MVAEYIHKVQYYETDKMGVTHHSNYLRIMEEARTDFLEKIGYSYDRMEKEEIFSPVVSISCDFKKPTTYADFVKVDVDIVELSAVKIKFRYIMKVNSDVVFTATSTHCCLNKNGKVISLKREKPEVYELFEKFLKIEEI